MGVRCCSFVQMRSGLLRDMGWDGRKRMFAAGPRDLERSPVPAHQLWLVREVPLTVS